MRKEKAELLTSLQVKDINEDVTLISEPLLSAWYCHEGPYPYQPTLLARPLCQHNLYSPLKCHLLKCVRAEGVSFYAFCCGHVILFAILSEDFRGRHQKLQVIISHSQYLNTIHFSSFIHLFQVGLLMTHRAGIQTEENGCGEVGLPLTLTAEAGCCKVCVARGANHILFIERVKVLHRTAKKEARKEHEG